MTKTDNKLPFSKKNYIGIGIGIVILLVGFFTLTKVDANAQNWAGFLAPLLIIASYITIGVSIIIE